MGFTRSLLLEKKETEIQLAKQMMPLWTKGLTPRQIAARLEFGKGDYIKLKPRHVYYYRGKFNAGEKWLSFFQGKFPPTPNRGHPLGKPHYKKKQKQIMPFPEFRDRLNSMLLPNALNAEERTLAIINYVTPLRKTEILERVYYDDPDISELKFYPPDPAKPSTRLIIDLYRKKKYYPKNAPTEPFVLPVTKKLMTDEVVEYLKNQSWLSDNKSWFNRYKRRLKRRGAPLDPVEEALVEHNIHRPWRISGTTALNWTKRIFGSNYYNHFWRANWISKAVDYSKNPGTLIPQLMQKTGLDPSTIRNYIMLNPKYQVSIEERELEIMDLEEGGD